jgi:cytochrome b subunit of formate dehydrogenase
MQMKMDNNKQKVNESIKQKRPESNHKKTETRHFQRFTRLNRGLHFFMILSFLSLAFTGLTLKFAYTGWAVILSHLLGGFESARYIHRFSAVIMISVFIIHLISIAKMKKKENKTWLKLLFGPDSMMFTKKDLQDFIGSLKWFLGMGERPQFGRWTYWEKFDYFAVFWGIFVIGSTGLTLWIPEVLTRIFPGWIINVATIIHSDEALLATGFIFTVHFFNTHLRPEKFPMDIVIFSGRVSLEEFKIDRPDEYRELVESGELEKYLVEPYQPVVIKTIKIFGWVALSLGFSIVIWIIYAMIFAYR